MIDLHPDLELTQQDAGRVLTEWLGEPVVCTGIEKLEGGMVNTTLALQFDRSPFRAVIKLYASRGGRLTAEARSLRYLGTETACPVPRVHLVDESGALVPHAFLLMERVPGVCLKGLDLGPSERAGVDRQLAAILDELHGHTGSHWGSIDVGTGVSSWAVLFEERLRAARSHPMVGERLSAPVLTAIDRAIELTDTVLGDPGVPTLVHGDVWDGNLMVQQAGEQWRLTGLLDPDLQFADVEYELAYLEVFDNAQPGLFAAYTERRPLRPGYEHRRLWYWLHTALVHVGLFGDEFFCDYTSRTADAILRFDVA